MSILNPIFEEVCDQEMTDFSAKMSLVRRVYDEAITADLASKFVAEGRTVVDVLYNPVKPIEEADGVVFLTILNEAKEAIEAGEREGCPDDLATTVVPTSTWAAFEAKGVNLNLLNASANDTEDAEAIAATYTALFSGDVEAGYDAWQAATFFQSGFYYPLYRAHQLSREVYEKALKKLRSQKLIKGMSSLEHGKAAAAEYERFCRNLAYTVKLNVEDWVADRTGNWERYNEMAEKAHADGFGCGVVSTTEDGRLILKGSAEFFEATGFEADGVLEPAGKVG